MTSDTIWESPNESLLHNEEFLLLDGDMFIGDTLMQADDWQFAPKGSKHLSLSAQKETFLFI